MRVSIALLSLLVVSRFLAVEDPPVFSGPQPGEALGAVKIRGIVGARAGEEFDALADAADKPVLLIFMHELTRPSAALTRTLLNYSAGRSNPAVASALVFLSDDITQTTEQIKRAQQALSGRAPVGISLDGPEGPGAFGLNRNVSLTVLVGREGKVLANFALVQPSVEADALKVAQAIHEAAGGVGKPPSREDLALPASPERMRAGSEGNEEFDALLRRVIRRDNTKEQVTAAAAAVESHLREHPGARRDLFNRLDRIISARKLQDYGTTDAQEVLKRWHSRLQGDKPDSPGDGG